LHPVALALNQFGGVESQGQPLLRGEVLIILKEGLCERGPFLRRNSDPAGPPSFDVRAFCPVRRKARRLRVQAVCQKLLQSRDTVGLGMVQVNHRADEHGGRGEFRPLLDEAGFAYPAGADEIEDRGLTSGTLQGFLDRLQFAIASNGMRGLWGKGP